MSKTDAVGTGAAIVGMFAAVVAFVFVIAALQAWILMLVIGALHSYFPNIPALGFWPVFFIMWLINIIGSAFRSRS